MYFLSLIHLLPDSVRRMISFLKASLVAGTVLKSIISIALCMSCLLYTSDEVKPALKQVEGLTKVTTMAEKRARVEQIQRFFVKNYKYSSLRGSPSGSRK